VKTVYVGNWNARPCVIQRQPFGGTNTKGRLLGPYRDSYAAYSYSAPIFLWVAGWWFENEEQYGTISIRHRQLLAPTDTTIVISAKAIHKMVDDLENGEPPNLVAMNAITSSLPIA